MLSHYFKLICKACVIERLRPIVLCYNIFKVKRCKECKVHNRTLLELPSIRYELDDTK